MRLFVGVWPPADVVEHLRSLPRPTTPDLRWSTEDQWHVTLRFLGAVGRVDEVRDALRTIDLPAAHVELGPATARLGREILMVPARGLDDLARAVHEATAPIVPDTEGKPFRGHLTVARARRRRSIPDALLGSPFDASWTATSFSLVRSQTKPTGAVYDDVEEFPLR
jgi:RNA 2',3'-cyclic 3'-phosphodiesterase